MECKGRGGVEMINFVIITSHFALKTFALRVLFVVEITLIVLCLIKESLTRYGRVGEFCSSPASYEGKSLKLRNIK